MVNCVVTNIIHEHNKKFFLCLEHVYGLLYLHDMDGHKHTFSSSLENF